MNNADNEFPKGLFTPKSELIDPLLNEYGQLSYLFYNSKCWIVKRKVLKRMNIINRYLEVIEVQYDIILTK